MPCPTPNSLLLHESPLTCREKESPWPECESQKRSSPLLALLDMPWAGARGDWWMTFYGLDEGLTQWGFWEMTLQMLCKTKVPLSRLNTNERMMGWNTGCRNSSAMNSQDPSSPAPFQDELYLHLQGTQSPNHRHQEVGSHQRGVKDQTVIRTTCNWESGCCFRIVSHT